MMPISRNKRDMVDQVLKMAGKNLSEYYIGKIMKKRSIETVTTIVTFIRQGKIRPSFGYSVLTNGIYE